jgi:O-antigen/teichoic acid export membrane protein
VNWKAAFEFLKEGVPYFLNSIFGIIYYRIDTVMLSFMSPESVVGWYGASYKFFDSLMFIPSIFTIAVFPVLSRLWGEGKTSLGRPLQKSLDLILLAGIPVSIFAFAFSRQIITLFYGLEGYGESILLLQIFSIGLLLVYIDMMLGTVLLASDKQKEITRISFYAIFINIGINYFFIHYTQYHYGNGGIGAGIATLLTELFIMARMLHAMPKNILRESYITVQLKALGAGILLAAVFYLTYLIHLPWFIQLTLSSSVYIVTLYFVKVLEPSEIIALRSIVRPLQFWK